MLCELVLGNLETDGGRFASPPRIVDEFPLHWWELERRAFRKTTRDGKSIRVLLPLGQFLSDDDVLFDDGAALVVVRMIACEIWVVHTRDSAEMGRVALEIGNLHAPAEIVGAEILIAPDGPVEAALREMGIGFERQVRRFRPQRCTGMPTFRISQQFEVRS
jgi:urease accessory protein